MGSGMDGASYITDRNGNPNVFNLERNDNGLWLNNNWANPDNRWNADNEFVFRLRKYFFSVRFMRDGFSFQDYSYFSSNLRAFFLLLQVLEPILRIAYLK